MALFHWLGFGESEDSREKRIESVRNQVLSSPELLGRILEKLDLPRQKISRLTCTLWNGVICGLFQKDSRRAQAKICSAYTLVKFKTVMESHRSSDPQPFPYISLSLNGISPEDSAWLCSNFKIVALSLNSYGAVLSSETAKHAMSVIKGSASNLRRLCIPYLGSWEDDKDEDAGASNPGLHFPHLEVLNPTLRSYSPEVPAPDPQLQLEFFGKIISASPRLKSMALGHHSPDVLGQSSFNTIQKLSLEGDHWDPLGSGQFGNLKELTWKFNNYSEPPIVSQALSRFSASLQRLYITWSFAAEAKHPTSFPLLPALTHLEVDLLHVDDVNWENLPNLRYLRFKRIRDFELSSKPDFKTCPSLKKVSYRGDQLEYSKTVGFSRELEGFFGKLFQRFPGATDWKVHHKDVIPFCKAAKAFELRVRKLSVYLTNRYYCYGDEDMASCIDRYKFSLLPNLQGLEELVLDNGEESYSQMKLSEIEFSKLRSLKRLKIYNYPAPAEKECEAVKGIPQVCMVENRTFGVRQLGERILSAPNVIFR